MDQSVEKDLVDFLNEPSSPPWYREGVRLLLKKSELNDDDLDHLLLLIISNPAKETEKFHLSELPIISSQEGEIFLERIEHRSGIGALCENQHINFERSGLNLVFGNNGCGKSSYARVLKTAALALDSDEQNYVIPNVFDTVSKNPDVSVFFSDRNGERKEWKLSESSASEINTVSFYDSEVAQNFVMRGAKVTYQPATVTLLRRLVKVSEKLNQRLSERASLVLENAGLEKSLSNGVTIERWLSDHAPFKTEDDLVGFLQFSDKEDRELAESYRKLADIREQKPDEMLAELEKRAQNVESLKKALVGLIPATNQSRMQRLVKVKQSLREAKEFAAVVDIQSSGDDDSLSFSLDSWRNLWFAAKTFLREVSNSSEVELFDQEVGRCVLCDQELTEPARDRLRSFDSYLKGEAQNRVGAAEKSRKALENEIGDNINSLAALAELMLVTDFEQGSALRGLIADAYHGIQKNLEAQRNYLSSEIENATSSLNLAEITKALEREVEKTKAEIVSLGKGRSDKYQSDLRATIDRLSLRKICFTQRDQILEAFAKKKESDRLKDLTSLTNTRWITKKTNDLSEKILYKELETQFEEIAKELNIVSYAAFKPRRGDKNRGYGIRPELVDAAGPYKVPMVLSEGEQTALGLAGFLTEALLSSSHHPIVFDDPVTSMDARRRNAVAKYLLKVAKRRQVIVFTHDSAFVSDLIINSESMKVDLKLQTVTRIGGKPGYVVDGLPWNQKDARKRIDELRNIVASIERDYDKLTDEEYMDKVAGFANKLSQTWERALRQHMHEPLMDHRVLSIKPGMIGTIAQFKEADQAEFEVGYHFTSQYCRHDPSDLVNPTAPPLEDLRKEYERIYNWEKRIRTYK